MNSADERGLIILFAAIAAWLGFQIPTGLPGGFALPAQLE
jgi:hypothetical protein